MSPGRSLSRDSLTGKLLAPRPEKSKIRHEIDFKKKRPVPEGVAMSELSNGTKKHTLKSRETIPLNKNPFPYYVIRNFLNYSFAVANRR
jgi:hypothetical protein